MDQTVVNGQGKGWSGAKATKAPAQTRFWVCGSLRMQHLLFAIRHLKFQRRRQLRVTGGLVGAAPQSAQYNKERDARGAEFILGLRLLDMLVPR